MRVLTGVSAVIIMSSLTISPPTLGDASPHLDGQALMNACARADEAWISFCHGYVQGALDGMEDHLELCVPERATRSDLAQIVYEVLLESPELQQLRAASVVGAVAMKLYPC